MCLVQLYMVLGTRCMWRYIVQYNCTWVLSTINFGTVTVVLKTANFKGGITGTIVRYNVLVVCT